MSEKLASVEARQAAERIRELVIQYLQGMCFVPEGDVKQRANTAAMNEALNIAISELSLPDDPNAQGTRGFMVPLTDALADSYAAVVRERDEAREANRELMRSNRELVKQISLRCAFAQAEAAPFSPPSASQAEGGQDTKMNIAWIAFQVLGAEWGLAKGDEERCRIMNWFSDVAKGKERTKEELFPLRLAVLDSQANIDMKKER